GVDVHTYWQRIRSHYHFQEFIENPAQGWGGIGVLQRRPRGAPWGIELGLPPPPAPPPAPPTPPLPPPPTSRPRPTRRLLRRRRAPRTARMGPGRSRIRGTIRSGQGLRVTEGRRGGQAVGSTRAARRFRRRGRGGAEPMTCGRDSVRCAAGRSQHVDTPACCLHHLHTVLRETVRILESHGIPYWADGGTLLGAVRDQAVIPWDTDADLGVMAADVPRVLGLAHAWEALGFEVQRHCGGALLRITYSPVNDMGVDLYPWAEDGDYLDRK